MKIVKFYLKKKGKFGKSTRDITHQRLLLIG